MNTTADRTTRQGTTSLVRERLAKYRDAPTHIRRKEAKP